MMSRQSSPDRSKAAAPFSSHRVRKMTPKAYQIFLEKTEKERDNLITLRKTIEETIMMFKSGMKEKLDEFQQSLVRTLYIQ